jgi:type III pantothenate kinase
MPNTEREVLLIDAGNTRVKGVLTEKGEEFEEVFNVPTKEFSKFHLYPFSEFQVAISSVVERVSREIRSLFPNAFFVSAKTKIPLEIDYKNPEKLGADRISNAVGGLKYGDSFIVASLGTATVVDVVIDKKFLGGFILPGIEMMAKSLSLFTDSLPEVKVSFETEIGKSTKECISAGVTVATLGALKEIKTRYKLSLILTGGNSEKIGEILGARIDRNLTFKGIYEIFKINRGKGSP